jgi:hypothetical protein
MNNIDKYIPENDDEENDDISDSSDDEETRQIVYNALYRNMNKTEEITNSLPALDNKIVANSLPVESLIPKKTIIKILPEKSNHVIINKRQFQPRKLPYNLIKSIDINKNNFELNNNDFPSL